MTDFIMAGVYAAGWIGVLAFFGMVTLALAVTAASAVGSALWLAWLACVALFMRGWK